MRAGKSPAANKHVLPSAIFSNAPGTEWGSTSTNSAGVIRDVYDSESYSRGMFYLEEQSKFIPGASATDLVPVRCHATNYININTSLYIEDSTLADGDLGQAKKIVGYDSIQQGKGYFFARADNSKMRHNKDLTKAKADKDLDYNSDKSVISWNMILQQIGRYGGLNNSLAIMCLILYSRSNQALLAADLIDFDSDIMSNKVGDKLKLSDSSGTYTDEQLNLTDSNYCELISCETDWEKCTNTVEIYFYGDDDTEASKNFDYENKAT